MPSPEEDRAADSPERLGALTEMCAAEEKFILEPSTASLTALRWATARWVAAYDGYDWDAPHWKWYRNWKQGYYLGWGDSLILASPIYRTLARKFWKARPIN